MDNNIGETVVLDENGNVVKEEKKEKNLGLISMILGILSIVLCCCGLVNTGLAVAAIVLAVIERGKLGKFSSHGMAGFICGIAYFVLSIIGSIVTFTTNLFPMILGMMAEM